MKFFLKIRRLAGWLVLSLCAGWCYADTPFYWFNQQGQLLENNDSQKVIGNFGGLLLVTPDADWAEKWNTPKAHSPSFSGADQVEVGQTLTILPFFANPKLTENRDFAVLCDVQVIRPDGSLSINERQVACAKGRIEDDPKAIFLSQAVITFIGEASDPLGVWTVKLVMTDSLRGVSVPLKTRFTLVSKGAKAGKNTKPSS